MTLTMLNLILTYPHDTKKKMKCCPWVGLEPTTFKTSTTANTLIPWAIGYCKWHRCITKHSLSRFYSCFSFVSADPLLFEIWRPAPELLASLFY